jgi:hypothetical protein
VTNIFPVEFGLKFNLLGKSISLILGLFQGISGSDCTQDPAPSGNNLSTFILPDPGIDNL